MSPVKIAEAMGVKDPQGAIDRWYARREMGRSSLSGSILEMVKEDGVKWPKKRKSVVIDDTPKGLRDGKDVVGYLGFIGTEPVTMNSKLVMWSFRRGAYVAMEEK